ncbi:EamA family transporter [soil metagenome]
MGMTARDYRLGLIFVTASAIAWSTAGLYTRIIALDAWTMLVWRGLFGAAGLLLIILAMEGRASLAAFRAMGQAGWLFAFVSAAGMVLFITSLRHTTVAHVAVIYAAVPFMAAALGWLAMRERPGTRALLASLAAFAGVAVMVGFGREGGLAGDVMAAGMTLLMAAMMVIARRQGDIPVMPAACLSGLISALAALPFAHPLAVSGGDVIPLILFGLVNAAAGLALFTLGARRLPAIETALIGSLDAPLAPLWVWLAFSETPSSATLAGGLIVFAAVGLHIAAASFSMPSGSRMKSRSS